MNFILSGSANNKTRANSIGGGSRGIDLERSRWANSQRTTLTVRCDSGCNGFVGINTTDEQTDATAIRREGRSSGFVLGDLTHSDGSTYGIACQSGRRNLPLIDRVARNNKTANSVRSSSGSKLFELSRITDNDSRANTV